MQPPQKDLHHDGVAALSSPMVLAPPNTASVNGTERSPRTVVPAIMDIEASGFGRNSYPIEVGYVLADGSSFCTLIRPQHHWTHWDPDAERVHQIRREVLLQHGRSVTEVADLLNEQLRGHTLYSDGWAHDYAWLATLFEEAGRHPSFKLDTLRKLLPEQETHAWDEAKREVGESMSLPRHRASTDARVLQLTWLRLMGDQPDHAVA
jgi:hypothetical protein